MIKSLQFTENEVENIAKQTGFQKRAPRKITALNFLEILCKNAFEKAASFNDLAVDFSLLKNISVSKQAFEKRMNKQCVDFMKTCLKKVINKEFENIFNHEKNNIGRYEKIIVQDSTTVKLPMKLFDKFKGVQNATSKVCNSKIQITCDLISTNYINVDINPYIVHDQKISKDLKLHKNSLILRDRGYTSYREMVRHMKHKCDFIYRHFHSHLYRDVDTDEKIDLLSMLKMRGCLDIKVCLNNKQRTVVRIIANPIDEKIANNKRRIAKKRTFNYTSSKEKLSLMSWAIYVTNIFDEDVKFNTIHKLYGLRWRIENIIKVLKSNLSFTKIHNVSENQLYCLLLARLIVAVITMKFIYKPCLKFIKKHNKKILSFMKLMLFIQNHYDAIPKILDELLRKKRKLHYINTIARLCVYDERKDRKNYDEILTELNYAIA